MTHLSIACSSSRAVLDRLWQEGRQAVVPAGGAAYAAAKRAMDVAVSLAMLVLLASLMLLVAAAVKATSRGPVLFRQVRAGLSEQPFVMFKFRTMRLGAQDDRDLLAHLNEQDGPVFKIPEDPRLTPVGRFLRRSSLDELPQLLNVLGGTMSLVGPRPLWLVEARAAQGAARLRTLVKPGLTCLWQISGRSELCYDTWVLMDLFYISRRSLLLDLLIMLQTVPAVLSGRGAY